MGLVKTAVKLEVNTLPGSEWTPSRAACMEKSNHLSPSMLSGTAAKRLAIHKEDTKSNHKHNPVKLLTGISPL